MWRLYSVQTDAERLNRFEDKHMSPRQDREGLAFPVGPRKAPEGSDGRFPVGQYPQPKQNQSSREQKQRGRKREKKKVLCCFVKNQVLLEKILILFEPNSLENLQYTL